MISTASWIKFEVYLFSKMAGRKEMVFFSFIIYIYIYDYNLIMPFLPSFGKKDL